APNGRCLMQRVQRALLALMSALAISVIGAVSTFVSTPASAQTAGKTMTTASGLEIIDSVVGTGASPKPGQICVMHYTGWLYEHGIRAKKLAVRVPHTEPSEFPTARGPVTAGWAGGVATRKAGGTRPLTTPPQLGYGARGAGGVIPPNATLMFDVELLGVK